ncbi:MAG: D-amino acid aminotransferase [Gemmatimonadetes bacterium]|nr:D-amino acid aminotransferase [Gemmatimonadota bacterium]
MVKGTHDFLEDPRNENVLVYLNGELVPRNEAKVSVFDAGFCLGDGVWEGIRLHNGKFVSLDAHLDRLFQSAKAIALDIGKSRDELAAALYQTVEANDMDSGVHVRLMVTRGKKKTPSQDPRYNEGGPTIVIIAEHKRVDPTAREAGIELHTCYVRRGCPDVQDPKINSHSKLNCILAMIQAIAAGADEALMLDPDGFVSTCNATNFFIVRRGEVWTSTGQYCLNGITRAQVIDICRENEIPVYEKDFTLLQVYDADESFVTGTFGGLTPVRSVDGRTIGAGEFGSVTRRLTDLYEARIESDQR